MAKRSLFFLLLISIFVVAFLVGERASINFEPPLIPTPTPLLQVKQEEFLVKRVIDGDTIELVDGRKVRYIGIDTPELDDDRKSVDCFGKEAAEFNKNLVEGKKVRLEKDVSETDKFGRLLRYVYVNPSTSSGQVVFVNDYLVRQGYASAATFPPDVKYQSQFAEAEREAREFKRGLWYNCQAKTPPL